MLEPQRPPNLENLPAVSGGSVTNAAADALVATLCSALVPAHDARQQFAQR